MFDTMIETRRTGARVRTTWPFPVAASMHFLVVGGMIASSLVIVQQVPEFEDPFGKQPTCVLIGTGTSLEVPRGEGGLRRTAAALLRQRPATPHDLAQPRDVQPIAPAPDRTENVIEEAVPGSTPPGAGNSGLGRDGTGWPWGIEGLEGAGSGLGLTPGNERVAPTGPVAAVEVTPDMAPPVLLRKVQPQYPALLRIARVPGFVLLQAVIGEDGSVEDVTVLRASSPLFGDAAVDAVRQWKYSPLVLNGVPTPFVLSVTLNFSVREGS